MKSRLIALLIAVCISVSIIGFCVMKTNANGDDNIEVIEVHGIRINLKIDPKDEYEEYINVGENSGGCIVYASYETEDANGDPIMGSVDVSVYAHLNDDLTIYVSSGAFVSLNNSPKATVNAWGRLPGFAQHTHEDGPGRTESEGNDYIFAFDSHTYDLFNEEDQTKLLKTLSAAGYLKVPKINQEIQIRVDAWAEQGE